GKTVELVITAHIKPGVTTAKIPNTAKVTYQNKSHSEGTPDSETPPTPPVTVTPPPLTKKINETETHLDVAPTTDYTYNIKTVVPGNISSYKSYVISDTLEKELEAKSATIKGAAADYFTVTVKDQVVTASVKDFAAAKAIAGQEVELVIVSQIREGVTRQNIPNTTKITFSHKPIV
ncbi:isopeptide-forming domain-containing fimbrial protein, partial [Streptococcus sp. S784/96/1]